MANGTVERRHFLSAASVLTLLTATLPAKALTVRGMSQSEAGSAALACSVDVRHADLIQAVLQQARQDGLQVDEASVRQAVLLANNCPYCRCPLTDFDLTLEQ